LNRKWVGVALFNCRSDVPASGQVDGVITGATLSFVIAAP
jgi:hypothetical protein